jgi:periplasmic protein CpxP/Spy
MKLRKLLLGCVAFGALVATSAVHAQDQKGRGRGGMNPEAQVARIDEAVTLTADQKTKITAIFSKMQEQMQALPQEERREKGMALREAATKEVRALLTAEQQAKFDAMPQGRGPGGGQGQGKGKKRDQ